MEEKGNKKLKKEDNTGKRGRDINKSKGSIFQALMRDENIDNTIDPMEDITKEARMDDEVAAGRNNCDQETTMLNTKRILKGNKK